MWLYCSALGAVICRFSILPGRAGIGLLLLGALSLAAFVRRDLSVEHPLLDVTLFGGNCLLGLSNLAAFINYAATFAVSFLLSLYLQYI